MKRTMTRLAALLLALALLLAGCAAPADGGTPSDAGASSENTDQSSGGAASQPDASMTAEEARLLERTGILEGGLIEISSEEASQINQAVAGMWAAYVAGSTGEDPLVRSRDWSAYTSSLGRENLSRREAAFYDRLDKLCLKYISTSGLDGVKYDYSDGGVYYATESVKYSDLGLSKGQAKDVLTWFAYNHPQYYFLQGWALSNSDSLFPCLYDFMADGEDRAEITNALFDKLEDWVRTVAASAASPYEKELDANNLICESAAYNHDALLEGHDDEIWLCQSLYSTVMLENTVCAGYAKTFCAMMSALGVDATAALSTNHAWNVVRCDDGNCYAVDVCWNDTDGQPAYQNDFLNVGEKIMRVSNSRKEAHTYQDEFVQWIPSIAEDDYDPSASSAAPEELAAPGNIQAAPTGEDTAEVTWDDVSSATGFEMCLYTDSTCQTMKQTLPRTKDERFVTLMNLTAGTSIYMGVRSVRNVNGTEAYSDWANFSYTHTASAPSGGAATLAAPTDIRINNKSRENFLFVEWTAVKGEDITYDCRVFLDPEYTMEAVPEENTEWTHEMFIDQVFKPGQTYYVCVRTVQGDHVSDWAYAEVTIPGGCSIQDGKPAAPANIKAVLTEEASEVMLAWDPVPGASVYELCAYTDSTCTQIMEGCLYTEPADEGESFYWTGLSVGQTYYFGIRAGKDAGGETIYSDWVNLSYTHMGDAASQMPAAPTNIKVTPSGERSAVVTWDLVSGAEEYELCLYTDSSYTTIKSITSCASQASLSQITGVLSMGLRTVMEVNGEKVYSDWVHFSYPENA